MENQLIRQISVDGFRTLSQFSLKFTPGLNVLVGPNGGGKTTILMFFSFLNDLYSGNLSTAISNVGGAGAIFRKIGQRDFQRTITAEVIGSIDLAEQIKLMRSSEAGIEKTGKYLYYRYSFGIELSENREDVFFSSQTLLLRRSKVSYKNPEKISKWDIEFKRQLDKDRQITSSANIFSEDLETKFELPSYIKVRSGELPAIDDVVDMEDSILHATRLLGMIFRNALAQDFGRGLFYNPQPDQIRKPEDSAKSPGIRSDGSGLYASLLALKRRRRSTVRPTMRRRPTIYDVPFVRRETLLGVVEYFRLAFPALHTIDVTNDPFDNQIRARVTLDAKDGIQLPLAALSDGTLKWMSLATALLTTRHIIGIEEPENFIHPAVQQQALELIRETTKENSFVLISSHSQSVLDATRPDELIIVTLDKSRTIASRIKDPERINELIYESGFGLAFYYMSGALADA